MKDIEKYTENLRKSREFFYREEFKREVETLKESFLDSCRLWGLKIGQKDNICQAMEFTRREFPKRYPKLGEQFKMVFDILLCFTKKYENGPFIIEYEITIIYNYYSENGKYDLIIPLITAMKKDLTNNN